VSLYAKREPWPFHVKVGGTGFLIGSPGPGQPALVSSKAEDIASVDPPDFDYANLSPLADREEPFESLNPRHRVGASIERPLRILRRLSRADAAGEVTTLLERVRLPARVADRYPVELSGGERQRVAIARALAAKPDLLVCDEVTSALDVSVQAAVLELLAELQRDLHLSMLFITHNLGVVACVSDSVLVMDRGSLCESGAVADVLSTPSDDYTRRLLGAAPCLPDRAVG